MEIKTPDYEDRFKVLPLEWRHQYVESLYEPYKVWGTWDEVFKDYPKLIDVDGNETDKLFVAYAKHYNGSLMRWEKTENGFYAIFEPKEDEIKKIEAFALFEKTRENLAKLAHLQKSLSERSKSYEELNETKEEIGVLFASIFDTDKTNLIPVVPNPYPRIFRSDFAYCLFEKFRAEITNKHVEYSFIYRKMIGDKLIHEGIRDSEYREWLASTYDVVIDKTKTLDGCKTRTREKNYELLKQSISTV